MAEFNYNAYNNTCEKGDSHPDIGYFKIAGADGTAVVRINYSSMDEVKIYTIHKMGKELKYKSINCLNEHDNPNECPLCASGKSTATGKIYVPLIEYVQDAQGNLEIYPVIWEKPWSFRDKLESLIGEYGDLRDYVFKIKKSTSSGKVSYELIPANPKMYSDEIYKKDFSAFDNFKVLGRFVANKTFEDLETLVKTGTLPQKARVENQIPNVPPYPNTIPVSPTPNVVSNVIEPSVATSNFQARPQVVTQPVEQPTYIQGSTQPTVAVSPTPIPTVSQQPRTPRRFGL